MTSNKGQEIDVTQPDAAVTFGDAPPTKRWFTEPEAAVYLGVSLKTLQNWRGGRAAAHRVAFSRAGKFVRYERRDLDQALGANRVQPRRRRPASRTSSSP